MLENRPFWILPTDSPDLCMVYVRLSMKVSKLTPVVYGFVLQVLAIAGVAVISELLPTSGGLLTFLYFAAVCWVGWLVCRCPNCQKNIFEHYRRHFRYWGPIPEFTCSRCGTNLTASNSTKRRE
jgi:hypothetical protein